MVREELVEIFDALTADPPIMYSIEKAYGAYERRGCPAGRVYDCETGDLPLHAALKHHADLEIVEYLYRKDEDSVRMQNKSNLLPIHLACNGPWSSVKVVEFLIGRWESSIRMGTMIGNLPIHVACIARAPIAVVRFLHQRDPRTLLIKNRRGQTPLQCAANEDKKPALPHVVKLLGGDTEELTTHMTVTTGDEDHE